MPDFVKVFIVCSVYNGVTLFFQSTLLSCRCVEENNEYTVC